MNKKSITYSKSIPFELDVFRLSIEDIPCLVPEKVLLFEKFIILCFQQGVRKVRARKDLPAVISELTNVKLSFVKEFLNKLDALQLIKYDKARKAYFIDGIDGDSALNDLTAPIGEKGIDCKSIYYVPKYSTFVSKTEIDGISNSNCEFIEQLSSKSEKEKYSIGDSSLSAAISVNKKKLDELLVKELSNNYDIPKRISYKIGESIDRFVLSFTVPAVYECYPEMVSANPKGKSSSSATALIELRFPQCLASSGSILDEISKPYKCDDYLPPFITLQEGYYNTYSKNDNALQTISESIEESKNELSVLKMVVNQLKTESVSNRSEVSTEEVENKQKKIKDINQELSEKALSGRRIINEQDLLVESNKNILQPLTYRTLKKYTDKTKLNRKISLICNGIDWAVSASNQDCLEEVENGINSVRDIIKQTLKVVFDCLSGKKEMKLWSYYSTEETRSELKIVLCSNGIKSDIIDDLVSFHKVSNVFSHFQEDIFDQETTNKEKAEEFMALAKDVRANIIQSPVKLFSEMNISPVKLAEIEQNI